MRKKILILFIMISLFSCSSNDDDHFKTDNIDLNNSDLMPEKLYRLIFGFDGYENVEYHNGFNAYDYHQLFSYNNQGKLIKVQKAYASSIFPVYLNLEYTGNTVTVKYKRDDTSIIVGSKSTIYTFDNSGKTIEKYILESGYTHNYNDKKYHYEYNPNGKLDKITLRYPNITAGMPNYNELDKLERVDRFIYEGNNLQKIISQSMKDYNSNSNVRNETFFSDYDTAKNPFRRLGLIESYFHRSLSENNYREIKITSYDENNVSVLNSHRKWTFPYDGNNNIVLILKTQ